MNEDGLPTNLTDEKLARMGRATRDAASGVMPETRQDKMDEEPASEDAGDMTEDTAWKDGAGMQTHAQGGQMPAAGQRTGMGPAMF